MDDKTRKSIGKKKPYLEVKLKEVVMSYAHQLPDVKQHKEEANGW